MIDFTKRLKDKYPFRIIIAGSRTFTDRELLYKEVEYFIKNLDPKPRFSEIQCVSGKHWEGADKIGEDWAAKYGIPVEPFPADWAGLGNAAGPIRNAEMAKYATHCIVFWDGKTRGSKSMIDEAVANGLILRTVYCT